MVSQHLAPEEAGSNVEPFSRSHVMSKDADEQETHSDKPAGTVPSDEEESSDPDVSMHDQTLLRGRAPQIKNKKDAPFCGF